MTKRTVAIIQARLGSSRLPGKVLLDICGQPMIARVINRVRMATTADDVVIATSTDHADDPLVAMCHRYDWPCYRGSLSDVLDRFYRTADAYDADYVIRVSADCPLIDPDVTDRVARTVIDSAGRCEYAANMLPPRTFPRGVDVEAFTMAALRRTWQDARDESCREHVTPWIYRNPDRFHIVPVTNDTDESDHRWTVDTPEDLEMVRTIFRHFRNREFRWKEVAAACRQHPEWVRLNAHVQQRAA
ncbi:MAG: glycosyltransferase family protein [Planctomycetaceae bacterium]|nr:glycosyltransferase family protein [Planctomycetaceae bacterium]